MPISFIRPEYLWLLLALPIVWLLGWLNNRGRNSARRWWSLAIRTLLLLCLIGSLAGTQLVQPVKNLTSVFLLDSSDSVSPSQRSANEQFIAQALETMQGGDKAAIIVFGENALVERIPSEIKRLGAIQSVPVAARTDIGEAIQLGMALFPADTQKRLVLLSDGGENSGRAIEMLGLLQRRGVPVDVVPIESTVGNPEVAITDFRAPSAARTGQELQLVATVESNTAQAATLRWKADEQLLKEEQVNLIVGTSFFTTTLIVGDQGFHRYSAQIVPTQDTRAQNNVAASLVSVDGPPRILLVEGEAGDASALKPALEAAKLVPEVIPASAIPTDLATLSEYEAILLINVPARDIPKETQTLLKSYVGDLGRGLAMIGGRQSFGVGGYTQTPIEEALPVNMDVRNRQERPDIALVFIIDKSGSMDACHCNGGDMGARQGSGTKKIDIAKEAVAQAAVVLGKNDKLGVVTFDDSAHWTIELGQVPSQDDVVAAMSPVAPNGQTNVVSGMEAALQQLKASNAKIKHAILLTDGWGRIGSVGNIAEEMSQNGITLSVVAAGNGSADTELQNFANLGGGRYYPARTMEEVPQIFLQETIQAVGTYIIEEQFTPAYAGDSPILAELQSGFPPLLGYNGTVEKDSAQVILVANDGSPILAQWQFGLGRSVAWTSDLKGKWATNWVNWDQFPRFVAQLVGWVLPRFSSDNVSGMASLVGSDVQLDIAANDANGKPQTGLNVMAKMVSPTGEVIETTLQEIASGQYQSRFPSPIAGTYLVQVTGNDANGKPVFARTLGLIVPYSPEYRQGQSNPLLLKALAEGSGGRTLTQPAQAFDHTLENVKRALPIELLLLLLAAILLPFDIAIRRLNLRRKDFALAQAARQQRKQAAAAPTATMSSLQEARQRARDTMLDRPIQTPAEATKPKPEPHAEPVEGQKQEPAKPAKTDEIEDPLERLRAAKNRARRQ